MHVATVEPAKAALREQIENVAVETQLVPEFPLAERFRDCEHHPSGKPVKGRNRLPAFCVVSSDSLAQPN